MNRTDDGFDQEPPIVEGIDPASFAQEQIIDSRLSYAGLVMGVVGFGLIGFLAYKITRPKPEKLTKKDRKNKKNR